MQWYSRHDMYHYLCSFWHVLFNFDNILIRCRPRITWRHNDRVPHDTSAAERWGLAAHRHRHCHRSGLITKHDTAVWHGDQLQPCSVSRVRADWCDASWGDVSRSLSSAASVEPSGQCVASRCTGAQLWPSVHSLLYCTLYNTSHTSYCIIPVSTQHWVHACNVTRAIDEHKCKILVKLGLGEAYMSMCVPIYHTNHRRICSQCSAIWRMEMWEFYFEF